VPQVGMKDLGLGSLKTRTRTFIISSSFGIIGTLVNFILVPDDAVSLLILAVFSIPLIVLATYLSHGLRNNIAAHQAKMENDNHPSIHNEDSISQNLPHEKWGRSLAWKFA